MQKIIKQVDEKRGIVQVTIGDERWYFKEGRDVETQNPTIIAVPSVTWIAGHYPKGVAFFKWLADKGWDEAEAIKVAAGDKGSKVHTALSDIFKGKEVRIDSKYVNNSKSTESQPVVEELTFEEIECIKSFIDWRASLKSFKPLAWDVVVFSDKGNYAGTIDLIAEVDGEIYIIDFKTSQSVWTEYELQISAYRQTVINGENIILEMNPNGTTKDAIDISKGVKIAILQLNYRRNKNRYKFTEIEDKFELFQVAQALWRQESGTIEPRKVDLPIVLSKGIVFEENKPTTPKRGKIAAKDKPKNDF